MSEDRRKAWAMRQAVRDGIRPQMPEFPGYVEFFMTNKRMRRQFDQEEAIRDLKRALRETAPWRWLLRLNDWLAKRMTR